jgi:hypothetical protein
MATNAIRTPEMRIEISKERWQGRGSTGLKERIEELLRKMFQGHGENFFDGL